MNPDTIPPIGYPPSIGVSVQMPMMTSLVPDPNVAHLPPTYVSTSYTPDRQYEPQYSQHQPEYHPIISHQPIMAEPTYAPSYDEIFPALPESDERQQFESTSSNSPKWNQTYASKPQGKANSTITQVFRVAPEERRFRENVGDQSEQVKICKEIMQKTMATIEMSVSKDGTLTFLVSGKESSVLQAKRMISSELQTQASASITVAKEHHRFILGQKGQKLINLEHCTSTKIYVPRQSDQSDQVRIIGTKESIEKAVHEIQLIASEAASRANERLVIEKIYHPFINGPYNETSQQIMNETGARINIPPPSVNKDEISISGEREAVAMAKKTILRIYEEKKAKCQTVSMEVRKPQHKYIIGPKGQSLQEIFKTTGVSVEMPPTESESETITLRGEQEKLGPALSVLYEKAHSEIDDEISVPSWVHKHILGPKGTKLQELNQEFPAVNVKLRSEDKIELHGPRAEIEKAKQLLSNQIREIMSRMTMIEIKVDPKYHRFIIGKNGANIKHIREEHDVQINVPSESVDSTESHVIRIEGPPEGVLKARDELNKVIGKAVDRENEVSKDLIIEQRFHKQIIGQKGEKIRDIREKYNMVQINFPDSNVRSDKVTIRGSNIDVDRCMKHLSSINKQLLEEYYRAEVPIFKQFHKNIIGKQGANIKKIRDETNTKIDLPAEDSASDVIVITGKRDNVERAKTMIQDIQKDLEVMLKNFEEVTLVIPAKLHNSMIGQKGRQIRNLEEEYGVKVTFPKEHSGSDKVTIKGPKDCVTKAKQRLIHLSNDKQASSFSKEIQVKPEYHRFLIGKSGGNINKIRDMSGARIEFPLEKGEYESTANDDTIIITGKEEAVSLAYDELMKQVKELEIQIEDSINVPMQYHKHFVARRGAVLKQIEQEFGGMIVNLPRSKENSDKVTLKGSKECVELAKQRIQEIVDDLAQQISIEVHVDPQYHRTLMGAKGFRVQGIQQDHNVHIKFPDRANGSTQHQHENQINGDVTENGAPRKASDVIIVTGKTDNCEAAKEALLACIPVTVDVQVPFDYHRFIIGMRGKDIKEMMEKYEVSISVPQAEQKSDMIKVSGSQKNTMAAKQALLNKVAKLDEEKTSKTRVEVRVDPQYHPKIIGNRGKVITKIRVKHDVKIDIPDRTKPGNTEPDVIVITGYEDKARAARDEILSIVKNLEGLTTENIFIDARVHNRLIGAQGKGVKRIMDEYHVDIRFPRSNHEGNPDQVVVSGQPEDVEQAKDHLYNLEEEYMDDIAGSYVKPSANAGMPHVKESRPPNDKSGFYVKNAPWEPQKKDDVQPEFVPDPNDVAEFPSMSSVGMSDAPKGQWGRKTSNN